MSYKFISSKDNKFIKELRKLHQAKGRKKSGTFLIEGEHLVEEAIRFNQDIHAIIVTEHFDYKFGNDYDLYVVTDEVMDTLSQLETPPGIVAIVKYVPNILSNAQRILVIENVQDPGNLGTMIRNADAFNFNEVWASKNTVDAFSSKVIRSTQGSIFHINYQTVDLNDALSQFNGTIFATSLNHAQDFSNYELDDNLAIIFGNEGKGVTESLLSLSDHNIKIEMPGHSESLNVAVASGIIMHHFKG